MDAAATAPSSTIVPSIFASLGLMTSEEMSSVLQVSPQTLATWRCKRRGPPSIKLGKKVFYLISDFNRWTQDEATKQRKRQRAEEVLADSLERAQDVL